MNDSKNIDTGSPDLVWVAIPDDRSLALLLYRAGDWAVTTGGIPLVDNFDNDLPAIDAHGPFSVTHLPSGRKIETRECFFTSKLLTDAYADVFAEVDPLTAGRELTSKLVYRARDLARARMHEAAAPMLEENRRLSVEDGLPYAPTCFVNEPWRAPN